MAGPQYRPKKSFPYSGDPQKGIPHLGKLSHRLVKARICNSSETVGLHWDVLPECSQSTHNFPELQYNRVAVVGFLLQRGSLYKILPLGDHQCRESPR